MEVFHINQFVSYHPKEDTTHRVIIKYLINQLEQQNNSFFRLSMTSNYQIPNEPEQFQEIPEEIEYCDIFPNRYSIDYGSLGYHKFSNYEMNHSYDNFQITQPEHEIFNHTFNFQPILMT